MKEVILIEGKKYVVYQIGECIDKTKKHEHLSRRACIDTGFSNKMVAYSICTLSRGKSFKTVEEAEEYAKEKNIDII